MSHPTTGIHADIPFSDYLNHPGFGSSDLKAFRSGPPAIVKWQRENRGSDTDATRIGRAAHCSIITPDLFASEFVVKPEGMEFRSKENKALRDAWIAEGKTILAQEQWQQIQSIHSAFYSKPAAADSLDQSMGREASVFWTCPESGLQCKGRPDWFSPTRVFDLKVSIAATKPEHSMAWHVHSMGWLNQLAHNRAGLRANGVEVKDGALVVIAPSPPQSARVWLLELSEADCDFLELENENTRKGMAACVRNNHWPGTPDDWQRIELPSSATWTELDIEDIEEALS